MTSSQKEMFRAAVNCSSARLTSTKQQTKQGDRANMATKKKEVKVRDLKPSKDAKGGVALNRGNRQLDGGRRQLDGGRRNLDGSTRQVH
jgi:hypothetical protein